jgi:membrane-associated phospholipid phosphatase
MYVVYWAPFIAVYQIVNRYPIVEPRALDFTWVDRAIPFVPAVLPVYVAYLAFYWWTVARAQNDREANWLFYGAYLQLFLSLPCFLFLPVRMPLEQFYAAAPHNWADTLWRWFDAPNNCFPSLHVSNCLLLQQFNWTRPSRWPHAFGAVAIIVSTVLVKQHYVLDVLGGIAVYAVSRAFLARAQFVGMTADGWVQRRAAPRLVTAPRGDSMTTSVRG